MINMKYFRLFSGAYAIEPVMHVGVNSALVWVDCMRQKDVYVKPADCGMESALCKLCNMCLHLLWVKDTFQCWEECKRQKTDGVFKWCINVCASITSTYFLVSRPPFVRLQHMSLCNVNPGDVQGITFTFVRIIAHFFAQYQARQGKTKA